jgi:hypothetical protein
MVVGREEEALVVPVFQMVVEAEVGAVVVEMEIQVEVEEEEVEVEVRFEAGVEVVFVVEMVPAAAALQEVEGLVLW